MTSIRTYDPATAGTAPPELPPLPIGALMVGAAELLQQAANLPAPAYVTVHHTQDIGIQFAQHRASVRAITQWARRFGGVVTNYPDKEEPDTWTWYQADFDYYGIAVTVYAKIPAPPATAGESHA